MDRVTSTGLSLKEDRLREGALKDLARVDFLTDAFDLDAFFDAAFRIALVFACALLICGFFPATGFVNFFLAGDLTLTAALILLFGFVLDFTTITHILIMNSRRPPPHFDRGTAATIQPFPTLTTHLQ